MIWANDFHYVKYTQSNSNSSGKGGVGGGGGKAGGSGSTEYFYFASLMYAVCEGPIAGIIAIRNGSTWVYFDSGFNIDTWPVVSGNVITGGAYEGYPLLAQLPGNNTSFISQMPVWIQNSNNSLTANAEAANMVNAQGNISPSDKGGYYYNGTHFLHVPGTATWASESLTIQPGAAFQAPPPYISNKYPSQALPYSRVATLFFPSYQMGQSATPPNFDVWVAGMGCFDITGTITGEPVYDAHPLVIINDLLTDPVHGLGASSKYIDGMGQLYNYARAAGLYLSCSIDGQQQIQQIIQLICQQIVIEMWWSEGRLKALPWYDQAITGYGITYTPISTIVYNLTSDHFLENKSTGPIQMTRTAVFDTYNQYAINFGNRAINYSTDTATVDDLGNQVLYGIRPAPAVQGQYIADATVAFVSATLQMQKQLYTRRTFTFKLPYIFALLEPMDIVTLTDTAAAIVGLPARILSAKFNKDCTIDVQAQELPNELHNYTPRNQQFSLASGLGAQIPPGNINGPVIFTGPARLTQGALQVWVAVSGQSVAWGGCRIWLSTDNNTFNLWGQLRGGSRYGYVTQTMPAYGGSNPDTTDTLYLQLFDPAKQITSVSAAQAASGLTLLAIFGTVPEIISYQTATLLPSTNLIGLGNYSLKNLYRGILGTPAEAHITGEPFVILDGNVAQIPFDISMLGQTIYLKFTSFNSVGAMEQGVAQVTSYSYTIGPGVSNPEGPSFVSIAQTGTLLVFNWEEDQSPEVTGYEIRIGTTSSTWNTSYPLVRSARGTHTISSIAPIGTWTFYLASFDALNNYSLYKPSQTFTVAVAYRLLQELSWGGNANAPIQPANGRRCDWQGLTGLANSSAAFVGCFVHPTDYSLVPTDSALASYGTAATTTVWDSATDVWDSPTAVWDSTGGTGWEWVNQFAISPPANSSWTLTTLTGATNSPNQLFGNTTIRVGAFVYPTLWGAGAVGSFTPINFSAFPGWSNTVLSGARIHPTTYGLVPDSQSLASFTGSDNGWEWVDNFVFNPFPSPSATAVFNLSSAGMESFPAVVAFSAANATGPGQANTALPPTIALSYSTDGAVYHPIVSGTGQQTGFAIAQYIKVVMTLDTTPNALNYAGTLFGLITSGMGPNYPLVSALIADSPDGITYGAYQKAASVFSSEPYIKIQVAWSNVGNAWPFAIGSLWTDLDGEATLTDGTTYVPAGFGQNIFYAPTQYRVAPRITALPVSGSPLGSLVGVSALTGTYFTAEFYNSSYVSINGTVSWTAVGS